MKDVVVIGAGPAGSAAAKRCAEKGLATVIMEKDTLPRDKVCSGMVMGPEAKSLVQQEFGEIPQEVLSQPPGIKGHVFWVPGIGRQTLADAAPLTWRRNLDLWMNQRAEAAGVELRSGIRIVTMRPDGPGFQLLVESGEERNLLRTRYLIGADGGNSMTRGFLFPGLEVPYGHVYQECYQVPFNLEPGYLHWFYPLEFSPSFATAHHKDDLMVMDVSGAVGQLKELRNWFRQYLAREHGFDLNLSSVWEGGCLEPVLYRQLFDRTFLPASGNALLVGDAAGLLLPVSGEGIGAALRSGLAAAEAVAKASQSGEEAATVYLESLAPMLHTYREIAPGFKKIRAETKEGGRHLPQVLAEAYQATLRRL